MQVETDQSKDEGFFWIGRGRENDNRRLRLRWAAAPPLRRVRLIERQFAVAQPLDASAAFLDFDAALAGGGSGPGGTSRARLNGRPADEVDEAFEGILAIARLRPVTLRGDDEHAFAGHARSGELLKTRPHLGRQRRRSAHVEAKLNRGRELVDVLPARTGGPYEAFFDLALVDVDLVGDPDHGASLGFGARSAAATPRESCREGAT